MDVGKLIQDQKWMIHNQGKVFFGGLVSCIIKIFAISYDAIIALFFIVHLGFTCGMLRLICCAIYRGLRVNDRFRGTLLMAFEPE